ncbi:hypothetical protein ATI53_1002106 [Salipiger aestuarii]|uniref:Uncharacterized protein n=1 Tax=Salipiger aestuarii TaxID=568098 RepID=A0A327YS56_9RHOB|nr:hypothetical protein ATI53_1002106 [Salipiger aestuarii]
MANAGAEQLFNSQGCHECRTYAAQTYAAQTYAAQTYAAQTYAAQMCTAKRHAPRQDTSPKKKDARWWAADVLTLARAGRTSENKRDQASIIIGFSRFSTIALRSSAPSAPSMTR